MFREKRAILERAACKGFPPTPYVAVADPDAQTQETLGERPPAPWQRGHRVGAWMIQGCCPVGPLTGFLGGFFHPNAFFP